jgi:hypothetical protein
LTTREWRATLRQPKTGEETGMEEGSAGALLRVAFVAGVAAGLWFFARHADVPPKPLAADAPATEFSSVRAESVLARILGPEIPHPASSAENAAVRARILHEYASLGIKAATYRALGCNLNKNYGVMTCGTVTDVIADVRPGAGKAVVMLAHYDSVPAGPGAADDESGDATIFETIRALKARGGASLHPVLAVNTDGEEFGLLGAASFLDNSALAARVGAVVNVEARGNHGPSLLFQTSPGDGPLIDLYAHSVPRYATGSLFEVIYKLLPNDTDLTLFIRKGFLSYNFAFSENVAHYHTALDRRENLDPGTLQMQGDNLLGMTSALMNTDFSSLKGADAIYVTIFNHWLPRMPASWALPFAILAFALLIACLWVERAPSIGARRWLAAFSILPVLVVASALVGWGLHEIATLISGQPDPSYAYPVQLRLALAAGVFAVTLIVSRFADARASALAVWLSFAALAVLTAILVPGLSPYYLFPALVASVILLVQVFLARAWTGALAQAALFLAAIPALIIWIPLVVTAEPVMGLYLHPLFTVPAAFAMTSLVPLFAAGPLPRAAARPVIGAFFGIAIAFASLAGLCPAFSASHPQRLDINYVEDSTKHRAFWAASTSAPLPPSLRAAAKFSNEPETPYAFARVAAYTAPAGAFRFDPPTAAVNATAMSDGTRKIRLALRGAGANQMVLIVPKSAQLRAVEIDDHHFDAPKEWAALPQALILCATDDCAGKTITLELGTSQPVDITIAEQRYGIPADGAKLQAARPKTAVVSQNGDTTVLLNTVHVPGG